jgi:pterin-4a-carbinolamine dehydratase
MQFQLRQLNLGENRYLHRWYLDTKGDAIYATRFSTRSKVQEAIKQTEELANTRKHHPHISRATVDITSTLEEPREMITITCSTHQPRGLGKRDILLARGIDEIFCVLGINDIDWTTSGDEIAPEAWSQVERHLLEHREAIDCAVCKK